MRLYYDHRVLVDHFDYELPAARIAQTPGPRGGSRLLFLNRKTGSTSHLRFGDLPSVLRPGDLLVRNDARVFPARLLGRIEPSSGQEGKAVELLLLEQDESGRWICLARPGRRARVAMTLLFPESVAARIEEVLDGGKRAVSFTPTLDFQRLERIGHMPLPPYIRRPDTPADRERYQTVFAKSDGAVAAPTAGLHFTGAILEQVRAAGIEIADLSLRIGAGTFRPVTAHDTSHHRMDFEAARIPEVTAARIRETRARGGRIIAVGTTVTRALESWAIHGRLDFSTDLFITPGFEFRVVDALLTNFHLPRSTLLMLVCAFARRENVLVAYREAIEREYFFYSYGDVMLIA
jgi:S-adenosylmethionine:tRNA ribosyltransferase-isomerase